MVSTRMHAAESLSHQLRERFSLERDPFAKERVHFFKGAQRDHNLDSLRHLVHFGDMVLLVTGEAGSGKTTLLSELLSAERDNTTAIVLKASLLTGSEKLAQLLAAKLQVIPEKQDTNDDIIQRVFSRAKEMHADGSRILLVIDNVQELSDDAVLMLLTAVQKFPVKEYGMVVVLSAPLVFVQKLSSLHRYEQFKKQIHQIQLKPLSRDDTENYVKIQLLHAGAEKGLMLSELQIERLFQMGRGIPGRINRIAPGVLLGLDVEKAPWYQRFIPARSLVMPAVVALVVLMLSLYLVTVFLYSDEAGESEMLTATPDNDKLTPSSLAPVSDGSEELLDLQQKLSRQESRSGIERVERSKVQVVEVDGVVNALVVSEAESIGSDLSEAEQSLLEEVTPQVSEVQVFVDEGDVAQEDGEIVQEEIVAVEPILASKELAVVVLAAEVDEPVKPRQDVAVIVASEAAFAPSLEGSYQSISWLLGHSPSSSVIQLLGSYSEDTAVKFLKTYKTLGFFYVKSTYKGKEWYVVLDGPYDDKTLARDRINDYPKAIQKQGPWVRAVSGFK